MQELATLAERLASEDRTGDGPRTEQYFTILYMEQ